MEERGAVIIAAGGIGRGVLETAWSQGFMKGATKFSDGDARPESIEAGTIGCSPGFI
jgi:hypothetical protein